MAGAKPATDHADIDPATLNAAQIRALFGNAHPGFANLVLIGLTAAISWRIVPHDQILLWVAVTVSVSLVRLAMVRRFTERAPADPALGRWERPYLALVLVNGLLWGSAAFLLYGPGQPEHQVAIAFVIGGMCAAASITLSPRYPAVVLAIVPALGLLAARFAFSDSSFGTEMALMLAMYLLVLLNVGRRMNQWVRESLALRFTNRALVASLSEALATSRRATDEAEASSRAKTRFLASASHDLRQPIHALRLFVETLEARDLDPGARTLVGRVRTSLAAVRGLLDTLLDISRLDAGTVTASPAPVPLGRLLRQVADEFADRADEKGLRLSLQTGDCWAISDPVLLGRVLRNLIENAVRYTDDGGVLIGTRRRGDRILVEIWDTGIGIPLEHQRDVFQEFFSLRNRSSDRQGGLGLGLAIVRRTADLLGHELEFRSNPGHGTRFRLTLASVPAPADQAGGAELCRAVPAGARVMIVDDDDQVARATADLLGGWGLITARAADLGEIPGALDSLGGDCDLAIVDYRLADDVTGAETLELIERLQGRVPAAIIVTGDTGPDRLRDLTGAPWPVLHKPVEPAELARLMASLLIPVAGAAQ